MSAKDGRPCARCGHREEGPWPDSAGPPGAGDRAHLWDWFDRKMEAMHEELAREREKIFGSSFEDVRELFSRKRRLRMFDTMFADQPDASERVRAARDMSPPRFARDAVTGLLTLELDTGNDDFEPDDVDVRLRGRDIRFSARSEKRTSDGKAYSFREIHREFQLPADAEASRLEARLEGGKVILTAPSSENQRKSHSAQPEVPVKVLRSEL